MSNNEMLAIWEAAQLILSDYRGLNEDGDLIPDIGARKIYERLIAILVANDFIFPEDNE